MAAFHQSKLIAITAPYASSSPAFQSGASDEHARSYCQELEQGNILFFPETPFEFPFEERQFLLNQRQSDAAYHKNIAYRPVQDRLTGFAKRNPHEEENLRAAMRAYSERVTKFLSQLLSPYAREWKIDFASFRPQEEEGRQIRLRARNDLLHVDSFPTRPTGGDRILRFFTNINPSKPRVWLTGETFDGLARQIMVFPQQVNQNDASSTTDCTLRVARSFLPRPQSVFAVNRALARLGRAVGFRVASPYDRFMHQFHNYMKQNRDFQDKCPKSRWEFPPNSSWMVFTDMVSHAVLSGQFALEQTYIVSRDSLVLPDKAPVAILERCVARGLSLGQ